MVLWIAIYFSVTTAHCLSLSGDRRDWLITSWFASSIMDVHCETWLTSMYCTTCISLSEQANTRIFTKLNLNSWWMSQIKIKQKKFQYQSYLWISQPGKTAKTNFSLAQRVTILLHMFSKYVRLSFIMKNRFPMQIWSL